MEPIIIKKIIQSTDKRLGRNINFDSRSADFAFDTTGIKIVDVNHKRLIPILDQGQIGSCTGNAGIGAINTSPFVLNNKVYTANEAGALKLYRDAEIIDGGVGYPPEDHGSSGLSIAKALSKAGLISGYQHCFTLNDTLKTLTKYPVIVGSYWFADMFHPDVDGRVHITGNIAGGHEYEAYRIDTENGRIWFHNSWGSGWGVNGDFYLTWADFFSLLANHGDVIVLIPPTNTMKDKIKQLQAELNQSGANLVVDGVLGAKTKQAVSDFIGEIALKNEVEPELIVAVATCEGGLNPFATLYNAPSDSIDRGLFQWNSKYHAEITDEQAFDMTQSTILACNAIKNGKLAEYWSASEHCWSTMISAKIKQKYGIK